MTLRALPDAWIDDALRAAQPPTQTELARHVWTRHEDDLRAAGDLLLTWQLVLADALGERVASGRLVRGEDGTFVPGAAAASTVDPRTPWTPEQVVPVVDAYLAMLTAEEQGRPARRPRVLAETVASSGRPAEQVERIWSNVSHVLQEHGVEPLPSCPPRSNVPAGVRPAVRAALDLAD